MGRDGGGGELLAVLCGGDEKKGEEKLGWGEMGRETKCVEKVLYYVV